MRVSVALAYYNGGQYIDEQLSSILCQLEADDEVMVSVDEASDGSLEYLTDIAHKDKRVHLLKGPGQGVVKNFEYAILHCTGDIIFLADQDDIWMDDKVKLLKKYFRKNPEIKAILHNAEIVDSDAVPSGKDLFSMRHSRPGLLKNFIKNSYTGCCMAFRSELIPLISPIPDRMYMHDYWIGTVAEVSGKVGLVRRPLIKYRRHESNVTQMEHGNWSEMIKKRMNILVCLAILGARKAKCEILDE